MGGGVKRRPSCMCICIVFGICIGVYCRLVSRTNMIDNQEMGYEI